VELITRNYWWLGVTKEVKQHVEGCDQHQELKNRTEMLVGKIRLDTVLKRL